MNLLLLLVLFAFMLYDVASQDDTSTDSAAVLNFLLLGDWGKGGTSGTYGQRRTLESLSILPDHSSVTKDAIEILKDKEKTVYRQMQVATAMGQYSALVSPKPSFLITLGDNFYGDGVYSTTDPLWQYIWKDVYLGFEELNIPWFPVLGNHDYGYGATGIQALLARTKEHADDDIWTFPATNYTRRFPIPGKEGGSVVVVFIDTVTLAPSENKCCNTNGGVSVEVQQERIANQLTHIERALNDTLDDPPTWLLVAGHYPMYSASSKGDTSELQLYLQPLLEKYKVHAYFSGHDHLGEHLRKSGQHTEYFVVGAGTMVDTVSQSTDGELVWAGPSFASFAAVNATITELTIAYRDTNGTVRYNYTLSNPNPLFIPIQGGSSDGGDNGPGLQGGDEVEQSDSTSPNEPTFLWSFWANQDAGSKIATASIGLAALGLLCMYCISLYTRKSDKDKHNAAERSLLHANSRELECSPGRSTAQIAAYGRQKYAPLKEIADLEQGEVVGMPSHRSILERKESERELVPTVDGGGMDRQNTEEPSFARDVSNCIGGPNNRHSRNSSICSITQLGRSSHPPTPLPTRGESLHASASSDQLNWQVSGIAFSPLSPDVGCRLSPESWSSLDVQQAPLSKSISTPGTPHSTITVHEFLPQPCPAVRPRFHTEHPHHHRINTTKN